jgi:hypothetical protein
VCGSAGSTDREALVELQFSTFRTKLVLELIDPEVVCFDAYSIQVNFSNFSKNMNDSSQSLKSSSRFILLHLFIVHLFFSNVHYSQLFSCLFIYYLRSAQEFFTYMETSILLLQRNWQIHTQFHSVESNTKWWSLNRCNFASVFHLYDSACSTLLVNWYFDSYINKTTFIQEIFVLFSLHDNHSLYSTFRNKKMDTTIRTLYDILSCNFWYRKPLKETWFRLPN